MRSKAVLARGCIALASMTLSCARSMLDCEPSEKEEYPSEMDSGGVAAPELEVHVLEQECVMTGG